MVGHYPKILERVMDPFLFRVLRETPGKSGKQSGQWASFGREGRGLAGHGSPPVDQKKAELVEV